MMYIISFAAVLVGFSTVNYDIAEDSGNVVLPLSIFKGSFSVPLMISYSITAMEASGISNGILYFIYFIV